MAQDISEVRAGITGALYVAAVGSTDPTNTTAAWPAAWTDLGILDESGAPEIVPSMTDKDFMGWQETFPVRTVVTGRGMEWVFSLIQKNGTNLKLAFGGGTITSLGGGDYLFTPPPARNVDYHAFGLEVQDGVIIDRFILDRGIVAGVKAIPFKKDQPVKFDLTVRALALGGDAQPWKLISNDPAMAS